MRSRWLHLLPAGIAGAMMAVQGGLNALLGKLIGLRATVFSVHFLAAVTALLLLIPAFFKGSAFRNLSKAPWYLWFSGPLGIAITYGVAVSFPKLGAGRATTSIVTCQLIAAYLLDHFGLLNLPVRPFQTVHLFGILLLAVGVYFLWR